MDENPQDVATDENVEVEEATESNENGEQDNSVDLAEELEKAKEAQAQILARAKKAEAELKKFKETKAEAPISNQDPYFADELRLLAKGIDGQAILKAKIIAKGSGITLIDAMEDEAVVAYLKEIKEQQRREKARLGASKGSGESQDSAIVTEGMSREDHQKAFEKVMANTRT